MSLEIDNLRVTYGSGPAPALNGVSVTLKPGEMFFLLGPSGCGKSTLLRSVAGFIENFEGDIRIEGASLKGVPPHRRDFGMVFQNYALFPHLTVDGNVAFGLEARNVAAGERKTRVDEALRMVGLSGYGLRRPGELSGGQQQRVALARALVIRPRVLLLDEPLSNLDARLRWEMREEIRRIHKATKITTLYVTHDQKEALSLADRMAILRSGKIEALGPPRELYRFPPTRFSAEFLGDVNPMPGTIEPDGKSVKTALGSLPLHQSGLPEPLKPGSQAIAFCRPESVRIGPAADGSESAALPSGYAWLELRAKVASVAFLGEYTLYEIELPPANAQSGSRWRVLQQENAIAPLADGAEVRIAVLAGAWSAVPN